MRIGFETTENYDPILALIDKHSVNLLSVHGRTVKEGYRSEVHYDFIGHAARAVCCPVLGNGNISSADKAAAVVAETGAAGVMIGRHAIRNPWIFRQIREKFSGQPVTPITFSEVREYIERLYRETQQPGVPEFAHVAKMKKYLNFVGQSVDPESAFLYDMRRAMTEAELFAVCDRHLLTEPEKHFATEPYAGDIARPNCETPLLGCSLDTITAC
jgi:tRNA-dihydrouridine synthase